MSLKIRIYASLVIERISKNDRPRLVCLCADGLADYPADGLKANKVSSGRVVGVYSDGATVDIIMADINETIKQLGIGKLGDMQ